MTKYRIYKMLITFGKFVLQKINKHSIIPKNNVEPRNEEQNSAAA